MTKSLAVFGVVASLLSTTALQSAAQTQTRSLESATLQGDETIETPIGPIKLEDSYFDDDVYIGPRAPKGKEANWLATAPGRGFFAILRLYGPEEAAIDYSWEPGDFEKMN
jgi:Protein of unknown function (DUF1214)